MIHAASDYFYLDCGGGGWVGANPNGFVYFSVPSFSTLLMLFTFPTTVTAGATPSRHGRSPTPSTPWRTSRPLRRSLCSVGSTCSGRSSPVRRTSILSCGRARRRLLSCSGADLEGISPLRCRVSMMSRTACANAVCRRSLSSRSGARCVLECVILRPRFRFIDVLDFRTTFRWT